MGVGAGLYMCDVLKKFTFAISSPDEFLFLLVNYSSVTNFYSSYVRYSCRGS